MKDFRKRILYSLILLIAFALWTLAVCHIDVQPIGPLDTSVGFACVNAFVHGLTGVHLWLYALTDWLGLIPAAFAAAFALFGLTQWIRRKKLLRVDFSILALGGFYLIVILAYLAFEEWIINYRPVLIEGRLEASYPSSTTLLTLCVMPTSIIQLNFRLNNHRIRRCSSLFITAFTSFMVIGRLFSGVHWFSDIVGGILLSSGFVSMYAAVCRLRPYVHRD